MSIAEQKQELATKFIEVANLGMDRFNGDGGMLIKLFRTLLNLRCKLNELWFIEKVGPFFYKFRNEIAARDINFFIERDWSAQRKDWLEFVTKGYGNDIAQTFENNMIQALRDMTESDIQKFVSFPLTLLRLYSKYAQLCKEEIAQNNSS